MASIQGKFSALIEACFVCVFFVNESVKSTLFMFLMRPDGL